jgi:ABC-type cobalamin/Fe3+-siderophores transport system ATPase subunit
MSLSSSSISINTVSFNCDEIGKICDIYEYDDDDENDQKEDFNSEDLLIQDGEGENNGFFDEDEENDVDGCSFNYDLNTSNVNTKLLNNNNNNQNGKISNNSGNIINIKDYIDLESYDYNDDVIDLEYSQILGLKACKTLLVNVILKPFLFKEHYYGITDINKFGCMYGLNGSGKKTLIKSFCRRAGIKLIIIDGSISEELMMRNILSYSTKYQPCVIYFDQCDHFFRDGAGGNFGKEFCHFYNKLYVKDYQVWTIFGSTSLPSQFFPAIRDLVRSNHAHAQSPNSISRTILFNRFLLSRYKKIKHKNFNDEELKNLISILVRSSESCPPLEIQKFISEVFIYKLDTMSILELRKCNKSSSKILPDIKDFRSRLITIDGNSKICSKDYTRDANAYVIYRRTANKFIKTKIDNKQSGKRTRWESQGIPSINNQRQSKIRKTTSSSNIKPNIRNKKIESEYFKSISGAIDGHPQLCS